MSSPESGGRAEGPRWLPVLLAVVSVLPNPLAALPGLTYYFRDFSLTYYPVLEFVAAEVRAGPDRVLQAGDRATARGVPEEARVRRADAGDPRLG